MSEGKKIALWLAGYFGPLVICFWVPDVWIDWYMAAYTVATATYFWGRMNGRMQGLNEAKAEFKASQS